ncbi:MAG: alpha/beta hydrolase, partial [Acidobacteriota bacterium]|nr:alpha/beta hydrolase [Acidobacteriota bacterium]
MPNRKPRAQHKPQLSPAVPPTISPRWLAAAIGITFVAALVCGWAALCFIFWQGSWQLLYHPAQAVTRTPASVNLAFDPIGFATTEAGQPRLHGWWIPAPPNAANARYTALYLHGASGNLGDTVPALVRLHTAGLNVLAFDYRGYGQSQFARPSEAHWREDTEWALQYLTETRHLAINSILLAGDGLGASLALEVAANHPGLAGVVLTEPDTNPLAPIFRDPRARLVPAHMLVRDRWDLKAPAEQLRIPSLWFWRAVPPGIMAPPEPPEFFEKVAAPKSLVWLIHGTNDQSEPIERFLADWLRDLPNQARNIPIQQLAD